MFLEGKCFNFTLGSGSAPGSPTSPTTEQLLTSWR